MSTPQPVSAHALLVEQHAFLRRLARSLVSDPERADDLAQDVAVLALRNPPRADASPRSWLARVLRNRAVSLARSETRRRDREAQAPEPAPQATPPELEARLCVQRAVIEAVACLEEPYRSTILLRYDQDLSPTAIAEHLGVPVATVKTRLARALERLRRDLDAGDEPGTRAWSAVLLAGLSDVRSPWTLAAATGGAIVGAKLAGVVSAVVVAAVAGSWWWLRQPTEPGNRVAIQASEVTELPAVASASDAPTLPPAVESASVRSSLAPSTEHEPAAEGPAWSLNLSLRGIVVPDPRPIRIRVLGDVKRENAMLTAQLVDEQVLDLGALFSPALPRPKRVWLHIDHPAYLPAKVEVSVPDARLVDGVESGQLAVSATLHPARTLVQGRVKVEEARLAPRVRVAVFALDSSPSGRELLESVTPDDDGSFRARLGEAEEHALVAFLDSPLNEQGSPAYEASLRPETRRLRHGPTTTIELEPILLRPDAVLEGRVVLPGGATPPSGHIVVEIEHPTSTFGPELTWRDGRFEIWRQELEWDAQGRFRFAGLAPAPYGLRTSHVQVEHRDRPIFRLEEGSAILEVSPPSRDLVVVLDRLRLLVVVRGDDGPVDFAPVNVRSSRSDGRGSTRGARTTGIGEVEIDLDRRDTVTFSVDDPRYPHKEVRIEAAVFASDDVLEVHLEGTRSVPPTLLVHLDAVGESPGIVDFGLADLERTDDAGIEEFLGVSRVSSGSQGSIFTQPLGPFPTLRKDGSTWTIRELPKSRFLVLATPRSTAGQVAPFLLPAHFEVDLREGGMVEHRWVGELGGVLRIDLSSLTDLELATLTGAEDSQPPIHFDPVPDLDSDWRSGSFLTEPGVYQAAPALKADTYGLTVKLKNGAERRFSLPVSASRINEFAFGPDDF